MRGDPLAGIRALVLAGAVNVAEAAVAWEQSGGDVYLAVKVRVATREYVKLRESLAEMTAQLAEIERGD